MLNETQKYEYVVSFTHYNGENRSLMNTSKDCMIWSMADGYGKMTAKELCDKELMYDFSHIRDSSQNSLNEIYEKLIEWFGEPEIFIKHKDGLVLFRV